MLRTLYKRFFGRRAIDCPSCGAPAGVLLSRSVEEVAFFEILDGGWAGHAPRPKIKYLLRYRCADCRHAWSKTESEF